MPMCTTFGVPKCSRLSISPAAIHSPKTPASLPLTNRNSWRQAANPSFKPGVGLLNVPKYTETTSLTYTKPISESTKFTARVNNSYVGQSTDFDFAYGTLPSYDLVGLRFGLIGQKLSC